MKYSYKSTHIINILLDGFSQKEHACVTSTLTKKQNLISTPEVSLYIRVTLTWSRTVQISFANFCTLYKFSHMACILLGVWLISLNIMRFIHIFSSSSSFVFIAMVCFCVNIHHNLLFSSNVRGIWIVFSLWLLR